jgi:mycofactocin precursor
VPVWSFARHPQAVQNSQEHVISDTTQTLTEATEPDHEASLVEEELLVEEVSIDGMCGVY